MPSAITMMAEVPVARPSTPSVMLAPLLTAVMMKMTARMYMIQVYCRACRPNKAQDAGVVELVILHEGDGGVRRLDGPACSGPFHPPR
jgi:hypothetical protein